MKVICCPLGPVQANCYILIEDGRALMIDPGDAFRSVESILTSENAALKAILLTHAHFDHMMGADEVAERFGVDVYLNPQEFSFLTDARLNSSANFGPSATSRIQPIPLREGLQEIGGFEVEALNLPGHTIGSTVFLINGMLFSGDVLFQGSVGRTDLPTGSGEQMVESIRILKTLPDDTIVYPGHGPATTIGQEKSWNPYF